MARCLTQDLLLEGEGRWRAAGQPRLQVGEVDISRSGEGTGDEVVTTPSVFAKRRDGRQTRC